MFDNILNQFGVNELPEVRTDVGEDLNAVIQANKTSLGIGLFVVIVLAMLLALFIYSKYMK